MDLSNPNLVRINNQEDLVPVLPNSSAYVQPSGEVHIQDDGNWDSCSGQDNTDPLCSAGDVTEDNYNPDNFYGPYDGIYIAC